MREIIDQNVSDSTLRAPLAGDHHAKKFAAGLPGWHPVRELFNGPSQWLGQIDIVYCVLRLFSTLYEDKLAIAGNEGLLQAAASPDTAAELAAFRRIFPNGAIYRGSAYKLHGMFARARQAIQAEAEPHAREAALRDFDTTFSKLVRAVRWS